jgi:6-phosphogluconolactonase/glucosamine-6-phosphate isomerase/deaminase
MANGFTKSTVVHQMLHSAPDESLPASVIHQIDKCMVMLDEEAYSHCSTK